VTGVIRWEDPPEPAARGRRHTLAWAEVAAELRARPGEWAVVYEGASNNALPDRIKAGKAGFTPAGAFEATLRGAGRAQATYARYVGDPS
jgi:hypothetical protein